MKNIFLMTISIFLISLSNSFSQGLCFEEICTNPISQPEFSIQVEQPGCGTCTYIAFYSKCEINGVSIFIIDSIAADNTNPECCFGTAQNNPIISGQILYEAAGQISLNWIGSPDGIYNIFTPSQCWQWEGTLGPYGIHDAVLVPCSVDFDACCRYDYEVIDGEPHLINVVPIGYLDCVYEQCFHICGY